jgi:adenosylmethionine-8-amino-7-oxononanoate aminotransferase
MHGPTFMANALACAVSVASVELLLGQDWRAGERGFGRSGARAGTSAALPNVADVRVRRHRCHRDPRVRRPECGHPGGPRPRVWLRPFRNLIYAMPPYICTPDEVAQITSAMVAVAGALT